MVNKNFAVVLPQTGVDSNGFYKQGLMDKIINNYPWLTVAGIDDPFYTKQGRAIRGVNYAGPGKLITFGTAKNHDVNWVDRLDYAREKGYQPVFDLVKDYSKVMAKLDEFAQARKPKPQMTVRTSGDVFYVSGQKVEVFDNFVKIGYNIIPRNEFTVKSFANAVTTTVTFKYTY